MAAEAGTWLREGLRVVLVQPQQPGNVGAVARAMKNMGLRQLVVVDPAPGFDLERAGWMATGARDLLDEAAYVATVADALSGCDWAVACTARDRRWSWPVVGPDEVAATARERHRCTAILFGREDMGLDNASIALCQAIVRIPTAGLASINLSQAVLLVANACLREALHSGWDPEEAPRQGRRSGGPDGLRPDATPPALAGLEARRSLVEGVLGLLGRTAYMRGRNEEKVTVFLEGMLHRLGPTEEEVNALRGMVAKTRYAVERGPDRKGED